MSGDNLGLLWTLHIIFYCRGNYTALNTMQETWWDRCSMQGQALLTWHQATTKMMFSRGSGWNNVILTVILNPFSSNLHNNTKTRAISHTLHTYAPCSPVCLCRYFTAACTGSCSKATLPPGNMYRPSYPSRMKHTLSEWTHNRAS